MSIIARAFNACVKQKAQQIAPQGVITPQASVPFSPPRTVNVTPTPQQLNQQPQPTKMHYTELIPTRELSLADIRSVKQMTLPRIQFTFRERLDADVEILTLMPGDVGLFNWDTPALKAHEWTPWVRFQVPSMAMVVIYKLLQLSDKPKISEIRLQGGALVKGHYSLEGCYAGLPIMDNLKYAAMDEVSRQVMERLTGKVMREAVIGTVMEGYLSEPIIFGPNDFMQVDIMSYYDAPGDRLVLGGMVAEPQGMRIA